MIKELKLESPLLVLLSKQGIHIKPSNRGKFTEYCGGKVTAECIARGKRSDDPKIRKRATFAANARKWKHQGGGRFKTFDEFYNMIPEEKQDTINYRLRRAFELAPQEDLYKFATSDAHLNSVYYNSDTGEYEFMKRITHPAYRLELEDYDKNKEFQKNWIYVLTDMYGKYVPKQDNYVETNSTKILK